MNFTPSRLNSTIRLKLTFEVNYQSLFTALHSRTALASTLNVRLVRQHFMSSLKRKASGSATEPDAKKPKANGNIALFFGAKTNTGQNGDGVSVTASKFDKAKWLKSLTPEQKTLLALEIETMHDSWLGLLKDDITTKQFLDLKKYLNKETAAGNKWFPPKEDVYSWSRHTPFDKVKVVILGQDPYHNENQAHGMAFSVRPPTPAPPSLRNMFVALANDYPSFKTPPKNAGLLTPWADRGVLLLNTCLTVRAHAANSHSSRGWENLTQKIIDLVAEKRTRGVVFMAWGTPAGKRVQRVDKQRHLVLQSVHPSPLSAFRGFFECGHFRKANEWLVKRYGSEWEIDWALLPGNSTLTVVEPSRREDSTKVGGTDEIENNQKAEEAVGTTAKVIEGDIAGLDGELGSEDEAALEEAMIAAEKRGVKG